MGYENQKRGNKMVHIKRGQTVRVLCDDVEIDTATIETVDQSGGVIFGACFASTLIGTFELTYNPGKQGWTLFRADGWTVYQPNGAVYQLEVLEEGPITITCPEGAD